MDDALTGDERALVDAHLAACPVCRQKLSDFQETRNSLRVLSRPQIPIHVLNAVRRAVANNLPASSQPELTFLLPDDARSWFQRFLMPYSIGVMGSLFFGFLMLGILLSGANVIDESRELAQVKPKQKNTVLVASPNPSKQLPFDVEMDEFALNAQDFSDARILVGGQPPTVNPTGALVALGKSLVRGEMKDEEVIVVADVFGDGLAQIAEVVEQPRDRQTLLDLQKALQTDPDYAPFVPAYMDKRPDPMQIVLKIQRVDVQVPQIKQKSKSKRF